MNVKEQTKKKQNLETEVTDMLMEGFETLAKDQELRKLVEKGDFSNKDFEWLVNWTKVHPDKRRAMDNSDRQHKMRVKRTVIKAMATLSWAHYFMDTFSDEEWEEIMPSSNLSGIAYFSAMRGGFDNAMSVAIGLDAGLNKRLEAETSGAMKAEIRVSLIPSAEKLVEMQSEIGKRLIERVQEQVRPKTEDKERGQQPGRISP